MSQTTPVPSGIAYDETAKALNGMARDQDVSDRRIVRQRQGVDIETDRSGATVRALVALATAVATALSGAYMTTRSLAVTALAAALTATLGVCATLRFPTRR